MRLIACCCHHHDHRHLGHHIMTGALYLAMGQHRQAVPFFECCVRIACTALGRRHLLVAEALSGLGRVFLLEGLHDRARGMQALSHRIRGVLLGGPLGDAHPLLICSMMDLARTQLAVGDYSEAVGSYRACLKALDAGLTPQGLTPQGLTPQGLTPKGLTPQGLTPQGSKGPHSLRADCLSGIGCGLLSAGRLGEGRTALEAALAMRRGMLDAEHPLVTLARYHIAEALHVDGEEAHVCALTVCFSSTLPLSIPSIPLLLALSLSFSLPLSLSISLRLVLPISLPLSPSSPLLALHCFPPPHFSPTPSPVPTFAHLSPISLLSHSLFSRGRATGGGRRSPHIRPLVPKGERALSRPPVPSPG